MVTSSCTLPSIKNLHRTRLMLWVLHFSILLEQIDRRQQESTQDRLLPSEVEDAVDTWQPRIRSTKPRFCLGFVHYRWLKYTKRFPIVLEKAPGIGCCCVKYSRIGKLVTRPGCGAQECVSLRYLSKRSAIRP